MPRFTIPTFTSPLWPWTLTVCTTIWRPVKRSRSPTPPHYMSPTTGIFWTTTNRFTSGIFTHKFLEHENHENIYTVAFWQFRCHRLHWLHGCSVKYSLLLRISPNFNLSWYKWRWVFQIMFFFPNYKYVHLPKYDWLEVIIKGDILFFILHLFCASAYQPELFKKNSIHL